MYSIARSTPPGRPARKVARQPAGPATSNCGARLSAASDLGQCLARDRSAREPAAHRANREIERPAGVPAAHAPPARLPESLAKRSRPGVDVIESHDHVVQTDRQRRHLRTRRPGRLEFAPSDDSDRSPKAGRSALKRRQAGDAIALENWQTAAQLPSAFDPSAGTSSCFERIGRNERIAAQQRIAAGAIEKQAVRARGQPQKEPLLRVPAAERRDERQVVRRWCGGRRMGRVSSLAFRGCVAGGCDAAAASRQR